MPKSAQKENLGGVPTYDQLMWPTLKALKALGGSATIQELVDKTIELEGYSEDIQKFPHEGSGRETKLEYNAAWARSYLKKVGAVLNSQKGVWVLLEHGKNLSLEDVKEIPKIVKSLVSQERKMKKAMEKLSKIFPNDQVIEEGEKTYNWKDELLDKLKQIDPSDFERLCQLMLRESGFTKVEVTGKTGDGGIDGVGVLRINLLSFHVLFQCKRYKDSVGSGQIRDFRGAFFGRGDKGLFITTGTFTADARKEASRDGAPAIDLIDGQDLCGLLKDLKIGVQTKLIEEVVVDVEWFDKF